jgi:diguanylate cyclase (GGDEF)-like protein
VKGAPTESLGFPRTTASTRRGGRTGLTSVPQPRTLGEVLEDRRRPSGSTRLRLLMVEDSAADGRLVVEMLREAGVDWSVERVERVQEALDFLERHHVDCLLLDLGVLDADGLEGLARVVLSGPEVPVVVLTRRDDEQLSTEALRNGAQDYLSKRDLGPAMLSRAVRYAIERKATELQLLHLAQHDGLTGLANRTVFLRKLTAALVRAEGVGTLFLDLDNLKLVNDTFGHDAGDRLLVEVGRRLQAAVRPTDTVARFGGDEFAILCPGMFEESLAVEVAERLMAAVASPFLLGTKVYVPSLSLGVSLTPPGVADTAETAVANADVALYAAKKGGKARFWLFDDNLRQRDRNQLALHTELRLALVENEFRVHYQPQVSLASGELVAVEALVRWEHPSRGLLAAGAFIDTVEEAGLVGALGAWVMEESCETLALWPTDHPPRMAINISARQFSMAGFVESVVAVLARTGVVADQIELEVTESALLVDDAVAQVLRDLADLGFRLAVDDFGTGFSSLNHLKFFPASTVKIDKSFVDGLGGDPVDEAIVAAVLGVARSLGLSTVGEGVETDAQRDHLRSLGCELGQGHLFDRALTRDVLFEQYGR